MAKIAVVTGASAGIGAALAVRLAQRGFEPLLVARRADKLKAVAAQVKEAGGTAHVLALDVMDKGAAAKALAAAKKLGSVEALVNNAGRGVYGKFAPADLEDTLGSLDLNVRVVVEWSHVFLQEMVAAKKGHVLNVASTAGFQAGPWQIVYAATKAFVIHFTEGLASELGGTGVTATVLCPGPTESEFFEVAQYEKKGLKAPKGVFMSAQRVAKVGVDAMIAGRVLAIPGVLNKASTVASKMGPRRLVTALTGRLFAPRR